MRTYHLGLCKGGGYQGSKADTLILQARRSVDFLSCELWQYLGERETTKTRLEANKAAILEMVNSQNGTSFKRIVID